MLKKVMLAALLCCSSAQAEFISMDSQFGEDTIAYDTDTGLGWLKMQFTEGLSYAALNNTLENDSAFYGFSMASYAQYETMINNLFPSLFTATTFYGDRLSSPLVDATEGAHFRALFGEGKQITTGMVSDGDTLRWASSNSWTSGKVAYTDIYAHPEGTSTIDPASLTTINSSIYTSGWFLASQGNVDLDNNMFYAVSRPSDVPAPLLGAFGVLALALLGRKTVSVHRPV